MEVLDRLRDDLQFVQLLLFEVSANLVIQQISHLRPELQRFRPSERVALSARQAWPQNIEKKMTILVLLRPMFMPNGQTHHI